MPYTNILITGASRGIGLHMVQQYASLDTTKKVFATCRSESKANELKKLAAANEKVRIIELEMKDYDKYASVLEQLKAEIGPSEGLDLLVNNAGIHIRNNFHDARREDMLEVYEVNVVTPFFLTRALLPMLQASVAAGKPTLVANISSKVGSISANTTGEMYAYRTSKAALNQLSKNLSIQFKEYNIMVATMHPGWVKTDMGGPNAPLDIQTSVECMMKTFENMTPEQAGLLLNYDGTVIPY